MTEPRPPDRAAALAKLTALHSAGLAFGPPARPMCFIAFFEVANPAMRSKFMLARIGLTPAQVCDTRASKDGGEGEPQPHR